MPTYRFDSAWHLPGPLDTAWEAVDRVQDWSRWWPAVRTVEVLDPGGPDGVGRHVRFGLRAPLGYSLAVEIRVVERVPPRVLAADVVGQLTGHGRYELSAEPDGGVRLRQLWEVTPTRWWMRALAPVARPAFRWSHDRAARRGELGLVRYLTRGERS